MTHAISGHPSAADFLAAPLSVGEPDVYGALAVFPVFGAPPRLEYVAFAEGCARGAIVKELEGGAAVGTLRVINPLDVDVLLYEGEEVLGAQQNRTFDVSVLVAAGAELPVPVSCVEQGRWDGSRHGESFTPAPQAPHPELRRSKARQVRSAMAAGAPPRAAQSEVWREVAAKSTRMGVHSASGALHDVYEGHRSRLAAIQRAIRRHHGQIGAVAAIAGRVVVADVVGRADVFAALHGPLVQGYALDALEEPVATSAPPPADARAFLEAACAAPATTRPAVGLGSDLRFATPSVEGGALVHRDELVQLTAFAPDGEAVRAQRAGILRPSRRRG